MGAQGHLIPPSSPIQPNQLPGPSESRATIDAPSIKPDGVTNEEEENMVIDIIHDSEDDTSSTTSGSDGGTTSTSHKYELWSILT